MAETDYLSLLTQQFYAMEPATAPWFLAAASGDTAAVIEMLDSGFDIDTRDKGRSQTALIYAVAGGQLAMIQLLLERGAGLDFVDCYTYTALTHAICQSLPRFWQPDYIPDPEPLKLLVAAGARFNLIDAFWTNDVELARVRLEEGANPNHGEGSYHGPVLMEAARAGRVAMIDLLLDFGANIEGQDDLGNRPLLSAANYGQIAAVKRLLERGADLDAENWSGLSALGHAVVSGHREIADLLFDHGAKRGIADALELNEPTILAALVDERLQDCRYIDWIRYSGQRIAMHAAARGNPALVRLLLDRGAVHLVDRLDEHSLLAEAARHGHLDVIRLLLERGADLEAIGSDGLTPLAWAIREGQDEAASLLREAGNRLGITS